MTKLTIIIPCYNEAKTLPAVLNSLACLNLSDIAKEIIIINDGSTDTTAELLKNLDSQYKIITHAQNLGKTTAIKSGLALATGEYTIIQDADLEYDPQDIKKLLNVAISNDLPAVYGSRRLQKNPYSYLTYYLGANFLTAVSNFFFRQKLTDIETCYKLIKTNILKQLNISSQNFLFENEVTAKLAGLDIKIKEIPISYNPRTKKQGKKIKFRHGLEALLATLKYRYKKNKNQFFTFDSWLQKRRFKKILKFIRPNSEILDLGCGYDYNLKKILPESGISYHGIDYKLTADPDNQSRLNQIDLDKNPALPYQPEKFNQIVSLATIEHLNQYQKILLEIYRVLKNDGQLYLTTPTPLAKPLLDTLAFLNIINPQEIYDHKNYFSKKRLLNELITAGFKRDKIKHQYFQLGCNQLIIAEK